VYISCVSCTREIKLIEERIFICCSKEMLGASPLCHAYGRHCRPYVICIIAMHDQESQDCKDHIYSCDVTHTSNLSSYLCKTMKAQYAFATYSKHQGQ
jgi:hypothetical protein